MSKRSGRYADGGTRRTFGFHNIEERKVIDRRTGRAGTVSVSRSGNSDGRDTSRRVGEKIRRGKVKWD